MDYVTVEELAAYARITDSNDDDQLELAISAASRVIDRYCNRSFGEDAEEVPSAVKQACLIQASRFFTRRYAPFGVAGSPESGSEMRLLAKVDPDVAVILGPYVTWWGAV
jgi:hypothetical protein